MSSFRKIIVSLSLSTALLGLVTGTAGAGERGWSPAELEYHRQTLDAARHACALGMLGSGSPLTLTRVSDFFPRNTARPGDRLVAVNGIPIADGHELREALGGLQPGDSVRLRLARHTQRIEFSVTCQDASPILEARKEALLAVSEERWDDCVRATYFEEIVWGGASSESARMRLWCHEARTRDRSVFTRLHAQLVYEYALLQLEEMQYVPGGMNELRASLHDSIAQLHAAGYVEFARTISERLASAVI